MKCDYASTLKRANRQKVCQIDSERLGQIIARFSSKFYASFNKDVWRDGRPAQLISQLQIPSMYYLLGSATSANID